MGEPRSPGREKPQIPRWVSPDPGERGAQTPDPRPPGGGASRPPERGGAQTPREGVSPDPRPQTPGERSPEPRPPREQC